MLTLKFTPSRFFHITQRFLSLQPEAKKASGFFMAVGKQKLKTIQSLKLAKYRRKLGLFCCEGNKLVDELLVASIDVSDILITEEWHKRNPDFAFKQLEPTYVSPQQMQQLSTLTTPPGILAVASIPDFNINPADARNKLMLVLDGIHDPGNLGTIIRTADWFGIKQIVLSPDSVDIWNPKVVQATMGSIFRLSIIETELEAFLGQLNQLDLPVYGALLEGEELLLSQKKPQAGALVIGSESHGIRPTVLPYITHPVFIPKSEHSQAESLNAAVAAAILLAAFSLSK